MNLKSEEKLQELREALKQDPRFLALEEVDREISTSEEIKELVKKKDLAAEEYEEALSHSGNDEIIVLKRKALYQAKLALDEHPLIKKYNAAYVPCKDILLQIDDLLFADYREHGGKSC